MCFLRPLLFSTYIAIVLYVCLFVFKCLCVVTCRACGVSVSIVLVVWCCVCCVSCVCVLCVVRFFVCLLFRVVFVVYGWIK